MMFLIRDLFRCRPGKAGAFAEMLKQTVASMEREDGFTNCRVMVDYVATYWTVVLQAEVDTIEKFDMHMRNFSARPEVRRAMDGYLDLVTGGHREIFRIV
jgi:hypothetical protein